MTSNSETRDSDSKQADSSVEPAGLLVDRRGHGVDIVGADGGRCASRVERVGGGWRRVNPRGGDTNAVVLGGSAAVGGVDSERRLSGEIFGHHAWCFRPLTIRGLKKKKVRPLSEPLRWQRTQTGSEVWSVTGRPGSPRIRGSRGFPARLAPSPSATSAAPAWGRAAGPAARWQCPRRSGASVCCGCA